MKKKNVLLTTFGTVAACCLAIGGIKANINSAADVAAQTKDYFVYGGSVKINDARGSGVRFSVVMSESKFEEYGTIGEDGNGVLNAGVTTGTLLLPYELTNGNDLTVTPAEGTFGAAVSDSDTSGIWKKTTVNGAAYMQSIVFLYNIPETDYGTEISVRGYINNGGEYTYTTQRNEISMSYVAKAAYEDTNSHLDDSQKAALKESYLDKTITYCVDGTDTTESVDYLGLLADCPVPAAKLDDGSEFVGWATKDGTIVKNVSSERVKNSAVLYATYRRRLLMTDETITLPLDNYTNNGYTATSVKIGKYDLDTQADALKADTKSHGEQTAEVTLTKGSETFTAKLPVLLITKEIANAEDFKSIQLIAIEDDNVTSNSVYGYYALTKDIPYAVLGSTKGYKWGCEFSAVFDGQNHTIVTASNTLSGIFYNLNNATIKNVTVKDHYRTGGGNSLLARLCKNTTLENVTFTYDYITAHKGNEDPAKASGSDYGWISSYNFSGNKLKNVTVSDNKNYTSLFGNRFANNTFDNVTINGTYDEMGHTADNKSVSYDEVTKVNTKTSVTLSQRQDFILDGGETLLDLGEYNGLEIVSVKTSYGDTLNGISSVAARKVLTDKEKHGEQNFIVTVLNADGTKVEITVPVTVITKVITTMADLQTATKYVGNSLYGYYVLGNDITYKESNYIGVQAKYVWHSGDIAGFKGTLDGKDHTITMNGTSPVCGLFGTLSGATIKNLNIVNEKHADSWGVTTLAYTAYFTTFENVNITVKGDSAKGDTTNMVGVVVGAQTAGCTWKKITITLENVQPYLFYAINDSVKTDTFDSVMVIVPDSSETFEVVKNKTTPDGVTVKKN